MKEILESKVMIGVALFLLGVSYVGAMTSKKLDAETLETEKEKIVAYLQ